MEEPVGQLSPYAVFFTLAFTIWMLVDAWKRRAAAHWYVVIMVMPLVYFVLVMLRDMRGGMQRASLSPTNGSTNGSMFEGTAPPPDLNRADELEAKERYVEAEPIYRAVVAGDSANKRALHGLARCLAGLGKASDALPYFQQLLELDREYAGFGAALDYADALWAADQRSDAVELLEQLAKMTGRINHRLALGHYLAESGRTEHAIREVRSALEDATGPNAPFTEGHRRWVEMGREMLEELSSRAGHSGDAPSDDDA